MVKNAFMDKELAEKEGLTSANSINLGRLLPQMVYAFSSSLEMYQKSGQRSVMIIPSGNVGNACASYWAKTMGAPIERITLALNSNKTIIEYLESGTYRGKDSIATLANAMDVGDPSNMERLFHLYSSHEKFTEMVSAQSVDDKTIKETIKDIYEKYHYVICPHTATGEYVRDTNTFAFPTIVYSTAHPAKFETIVEPIIHTTIEIPTLLSQLLEKEQHFSQVGCDYHLIF
jgi:threonine synthase